MKDRDDRNKPSGCGRTRRAGVRPGLGRARPARGRRPVSTADSGLTPEFALPGLSRPSTTIFEAFHESSHKPWLRFAHLQVGSREAAEQVVHETYVHLVSVWEHALQQESVEGYGWTLLTEHIAAWLARHERAPALVQTAVFEADLSTVLVSVRERLRLLESNLGLYSAIADLPGRQYEVIVLRYILGLEDERVAWHLGVSEPTVRSLARHARNKLEQELTLDAHHEE
jgi:RNA polymerase sigma factor (sigma-70 family)